MIKEDITLFSKGSHQLVAVTCDLGLSDKCRKEMNKQIKTVIRDRGKNNGQDVCFFCSRSLKYSGRSNSNCSYPLDDNLFTTIDSKEKAYVLGLIASDGSISKGFINISLKESDESSLTLLKLVSEWCKCGPIASKKNKDICGICLNSTQIVSDVLRHLKLPSYGKKCFSIKFPELLPQIGRAHV